MKLLSHLQYLAVRPLVRDLKRCPDAPARQGNSDFTACGAILRALRARVRGSA